jgi:transposase
MTRSIKPINWAESSKELEQRFKQEKHPERRKRLQALWFVSQGKEVQEASREVGTARSSLTRWLNWYRNEGLEAVLIRIPAHKAVGRKVLLNPEQQTQLLEQCEQGRFRTYQEARTWVAKEFGVEYKYTGMYERLSRLKVHPKVPRPHAVKADDAKQLAWKKGVSKTSLRS